jgi:site-specific recombinase XerD
MRDSIQAGNRISGDKVVNMSRSCYQVGSVKQEKRVDGWWWFGRYHTYEMVAGERKRKDVKLKLGRVEELTERQARKELQPYVDAVNKQFEVGPLHLETYNKFIDRWKRDALPMLAKSTQSMYASELKHGLLPVFGDLLFKDITAHVVQRFVTDAERRGVASKRIHNWIGVFKSTWRDAKRWNNVTHNPFEDLRMPPIDFPEQRCYSNSECSLLKGMAVRVADTGKVPGWFPLMLAIWSEAGMRYSEIHVLRAGHLHWSDSGRCTIKLEETGWCGHLRPRGKTRAAMREFRLSLSLSTFIRESICSLGYKPEDRLFPTRTGRPVGYSTARKYLLRVARAARIGSAQTKAFRHHAVTEMVKNGVMPSIRHRRTGHAGERSQRAYEHAHDESENAYVDYLATHLAPQEVENIVDVVQ